MSKVDLSILDLSNVAPVPQSDSSKTEIDKKLVLVLISLGEPTEAVAKKLGLRPEFINALVSSKEGSEEIIRLQSALFPDPQVRIKRMANLALDVKARLMVSAKSEAVRNAASTDILDRAGGKAVQRTEIVNNLDDLSPEQLDRTIEQQQVKLAKLQETEDRIRAARPVVAIE